MATGEWFQLPAATSPAELDLRSLLSNRGNHLAGMIPVSTENGVRDGGDLIVTLKGHGSTCNSMWWLHVQVRYLGLIERLKELMLDPVYDLNAAVYTELSDVEAEINGLITYDRQVMLAHRACHITGMKDLLIAFL